MVLFRGFLWKQEICIQIYRNILLLIYYSYKKVWSSLIKGKRKRKCPVLGFYYSTFSCQWMLFASQLTEFRFSLFHSVDVHFQFHILPLQSHLPWRHDSIRFWCIFKINEMVLSVVVPKQPHSQYSIIYLYIFLSWTFSPAISVSLVALSFGTGPLRGWFCTL